MGRIVIDEGGRGVVLLVMLGISSRYFGWEPSAGTDWGHAQAFSVFLFCFLSLMFVRRAWFGYTTGARRVSMHLVTMMMMGWGLESMVLGFGWGWVGTQVFMDGKESWDVSRLCHGIRCVGFQGLGRGIRGLGGYLCMTLNSSGRSSWLGPRGMMSSGLKAYSFVESCKWSVILEARWINKKSDGPTPDYLPLVCVTRQFEVWSPSG
jgi:hypothetical protein